MQESSNKDGQQQGNQHYDPIAYFEESVKLAANFDQSTRESARTAAAQSESMMRDYGTYSLLELGGAITFLSAAPHLIKTPSLFLVAVLVLLSCLIVSLLVRRSWNKYVMEVHIALNKAQLAISGAFGNWRINPSPQNQGAFTAIVSQQVDLPNIQPLATRGQDAAGVLFILGTLFLAASLAFRIGF